MKHNRIAQRILAGTLGLAGIVTVSACAPGADNTATQAPVTQDEVSQAPVAMEGTTTGEAGNIVELAANQGSFNTLTQAIETAGLTETLSGEGPFTVFAPTDEAFAALPDGTLDELLLPENRELLQQVLAYHVVPGEVTSADITPGEVETVQGESVNIQVDQTSGAVTVNNATVVEPDIEASNGVIHAVDTLILPPDVQANVDANSAM